MSRFPFLLQALLALPVSEQARAQDPGDEPGQGEAIIVVGRPLPLPPGTPAYGSVTIDRERLLSSASNRLEDVLLDVAGSSNSGVRTAARPIRRRRARPCARWAAMRPAGRWSCSTACRWPIPSSGIFHSTRWCRIACDGAGDTRRRVGCVRCRRGRRHDRAYERGRRDLPRLSASAFYGTDEATELTGGIAPEFGRRLRLAFRALGQRRRFPDDAARPARARDSARGL